MEFGEFKDYAVENIKKYLPQEYQDAEVNIVQTVKNNDITLNALCVIGKDNAVPSLYLEQFYACHLFGASLEEVMKSMADIYLENRRPDIFTEEEFEYEKLKDSICVTVCSTERNHKLLQDVPHELREDFALVYRVRVKLDNQEEGTVLIQNSHLKRWGIDEQTLREKAWHNMEHSFTYELTSIYELIKEEFGLEELPGDGRQPEVYMLSNHERLYGAVYMFDRKAMGGIAEKLASDIILLPVSVHECILLKSNDEKGLEGLRKLVEDIDEMDISPEYALSKELYLFSRQEQTLSKMDFSQDQEMGMTPLM